MARAINAKSSWKIMLRNFATSRPLSLSENSHPIMIKDPPLVTKSVLEEKALTRRKLLEQEIIQEQPMVISAITGVPEEHIKERRVRIAKAPKNAMQSGTDNTHNWVMQFDTRQRWENPLMGWCSSGDPLSNLQLSFASKEEAINLCIKNGWPWYVEPEKPIKARKKSYAENFSWNRKTRVSTK